MSLMSRVDPELAAPIAGYVAAMGADFITSRDAATRRADFARFVLQITPPERPFPQVDRRDLTVPSRDADRAIGLRIFTPPAYRPGSGVIYYIHGGGFVLGSVDGEDAPAAALAQSLGCLVVSVEYRLAPEHPYPAPVEDCYDGLGWLAANAAELGADPARIAVYGASAGGGLAAATALMARDRDGPAVAFQMLCYPMLDHRNATASCAALTGLGAWDAPANATCWREYLGGRGDAPAYAAPTQATDLAGLPPTFIDVGALDILIDEDLDYTRRLNLAGVPVETHVYPGAYHGFDAFAPMAAVSQRAVSARIAALRAVVGVPAAADAITFGSPSHR